MTTRLLRSQAYSTGKGNTGGLAPSSASTNDSQESAPPLTAAPPFTGGFSGASEWHDALLSSRGLFAAGALASDVPPMIMASPPTPAGAPAPPNPPSIKMNDNEASVDAISKMLENAEPKANGLGQQGVSKTPPKGDIFKDALPMQQSTAADMGLSPNPVGIALDLIVSQISALAPRLKLSENEHVQMGIWTSLKPGIQKMFRSYINDLLLPSTIDSSSDGNSKKSGADVAAKMVTDSMGVELDPSNTCFKSLVQNLSTSAGPDWRNIGLIYRFASQAISPDGIFRNQLDGLFAGVFPEVQNVLAQVPQRTGFPSRVTPQVRLSMAQELKVSMDIMWGCFEKMDKNDLIKFKQGLDRLISGQCSPNDIKALSEFVKKMLNNFATCLKDGWRARATQPN